MNKVQYHGEICDRIKKLYEDKNHDYGDSVNDTFKKFGIDAFLVRMYDKLNRVYSLTRTQAEAKVQDEKIEDTLLDLANYAIIALVELQNERIQMKENACCEAPSREIIDNIMKTVKEGKHIKGDII